MKDENYLYKVFLFLLFNEKVIFGKHISYISPMKSISRKSMQLKLLWHYNNIN